MTIQEEIDRLCGLCIQCGRCTGVCPSFKHGGIDPKEVMAGSRENLLCCIQCGNCSAVCPKTDPYIVMKDLVALTTDTHVSQMYRDTGLSQPIQDRAREVDLEPVWDGDDVKVMPGCVIRCRAPFLEYAAAEAVKSIGLTCSELEGWSCCVRPFQFREMTDAERDSRKRSMATASGDSDLLSLCAGCDDEFEKSGVDSEHIVGFLHRNLDSLPRFDRPIKVALEPGCSAMKSLDKMIEVVERLGCEYIGNGTGCCGKMTKVSAPLMDEREKECEGADLIVVGCPMCFVKYDSQPDGIPVVYLAELVAMAAGDTKSLGYHTIPVDVL